MKSLSIAAILIIASLAAFPAASQKRDNQWTAEDFAAIKLARAAAARDHFSLKGVATEVSHQGRQIKITFIRAPTPNKQGGVSKYFGPKSNRIFVVQDGRIVERYYER